MRTVIGGIDITSLLKSRDQFEKYRNNISTEQERAGAVQAFEYTYEIAWKTMKRVLTYQGLLDINTPRTCFRAAAKTELISDLKDWFYFVEIRNLTVHTYNQDNAEKVVDAFEKFSVSLNQFIGNLQKLS